MSSSRSDQINRVKIITSKFEGLNGQNAARTSPGKDLPQKTHNSRSGDSCIDNYSIKYRVLNGNNSTKENFGPSCNFGNRKRLKDTVAEKDILKLSEEKVNSEPFISSVETKADFKNDSSSRILSRQYSDPVKKLQRKPAFRCDRSEKIRDSRRNSSDRSPEPVKQSEICKGREKLKQLGSMIEERLKEDDLTFSSGQNKKDLINHKTNLNDRGFNLNVVNKSSDSVENKSDVAENSFFGESFDIAKMNDNIPQHILDMYAKVLKPKTKGIFSRNDLITKGDAVFSDSGVSSESENLISDDLEESKHSNNVFEKSVQNDDMNESNENVCASKNNLEIESFIAKNGNNSLNSSISIDEELFMKSKRALVSGDVSVDTLKKVLREPLPLGPPPKKPPRIFASSSDQNSPKKSPTKVGKSTNDAKPKLKSLSSSKNKPHRSKEESKMMLDKIENALKKHKSTGKILSPRLGVNVLHDHKGTKDNLVHQAEDSISTTSTQPSTVRLRKSSKSSLNSEENASSNKPKEVHYMCTELLDLPFLDKHSNTNTSNGSIASSEEIHQANYLTKCFNSLNCANVDARHSTVFYSKFGSSPNSANNSFVDACCYCNLKDRSCSKDCEKSDSAMRLSTFFNPNRSLERGENVKCKRCGLNEKRGDSFKCHLDCKCVQDDGNSSFFTRQSQSSSPNEVIKYGTLLKSKSQEHIYDEPINVVNMRRSEDRSRDESDERFSFVRSATQLEDKFKKYNRSSLINVFETPSDDQFVRNDFKSKTMGRIPSEFKQSKVEEISKVLDKKNRTMSASNECDIRISKDDDVHKKHFKSKPLHYMCSYIYDTPQAEEDNSDAKNDRKSENSRIYEESFPISKQPNDRSSPVKKFGFFERKSKDGPSRPQNLDFAAPERKTDLRTRIQGFGPANDVDKKNLDRLMTEIYDTVTAVCMIDSPTKDGKISPGDLQNNTESNDASQNSLIFNDKEMTDASLQLTRSLTEKRKRYVRRVASKVEIYAPISVTSIRRHRSSSLVKKEDNKIEDITLSLPIKYDFKKLKAVFEQDKVSENTNKTSETQVNKQELTTEKCKDRLFDACALIGMNLSTGQAYVKSVYPEHASVPPQIESFVFPESSECNDVDSVQNNNKIKLVKYELSPENAQSYSLVLTNEHGKRSYGYCRRVVPEGAPFCLPIAYCIITPYRVPAFYNKILQEIEIHHGSSEVIVKSILDQLYNEEMPKPGQSIFIKQMKTPRKSSINDFKKNSFYRSSVNLGEVLNKFSYCDNNGNSTLINRSDNLENVSNANKNLRRKSTDLSLKFSDPFSGEYGTSVVQSLEHIYGEEYRENIKKNGGLFSELKRNALNVNENCFEREFGSKNDLNVLAIPKSGIESLQDLCKSASASKIKPDNEVTSSNEVEYYETPIKLLRPLEPRLEEDNLSVLFNSISVGVLVKIFGTLLLERKVILISNKLSQLSSCIEALQSILYPLIWQHTVIATIPSYLRRDILDAPIPILAGVLYNTDQNRKKIDNDNKNFNKDKLPKSDKSTNGSDECKSNFYFDSSEQEASSEDLYEEIRSSDFEEGMIVDITSSNDSPSEKVLKYQGDESTLLPPVLSKTLKAALQLGPSISSSGANFDSQARKSRNILIAEAFLRFFVVLLGDYKNFIKTPTVDSSSEGGSDFKTSIIFNKEQFIKSSPSKHIQFFMDWFTETAMFSNFIKNKAQNGYNYHSEDSDLESSIPYPDFYDIFDERINLLEDSKKQYAEASRHTKNDSSSNSKNNYKLKIKTWRDKLRDLIN